MQHKEIAGMIFINHNNEILLQKRGSYSKYGEEFSFFGGGIETGESPEVGLLRELKEELDLDLNHEDCIFLGSFPQENQVAHAMEIRHMYLCRTNKKADEFHVMEGEGAIFFTIQEAKKLSFPSPSFDILDTLQTYLSAKYIET